MKYRIGNTKDFPEGKIVHVEVEGFPLVVIRKNGKFYALEDRCSHADAPLSGGILEGNELECPYHGARFDIQTGKALSLPAVSPVETFRVLQEDEDLYIESEFL